MKIDPEHIPILEEILWEFMDSKPDTDMYPSKRNEGRWYLACTTFNPKWYQDMCRDFPRGYDKHNKKGPNKKNPRTIVKRKNTIKVIEGMIKNLCSDSKYASYIVGEAERRLESYTEFNENKPFDNQF